MPAVTGQAMGDQAGAQPSAVIQADDNAPTPAEKSAAQKSPAAPAVRIDRQPADGENDGIWIVWLDAPGKPVNALSPKIMAELSDAVATIEREKPASVIFASAKPRNFIAGADLFEIRKMDHAGVVKFLADGQAIFQRIASLPMPTAAAINGDCLGGGLELALACSQRVAVDDGSVNIGLPEVKLGILPGWGGTTRLPRLIGLMRALPLLLTGKLLPPKKAVRAGIIDEVVRPEALLTACRRRLGISATHEKTEPPERRHLGLKDRMAGGATFLRHRILTAARGKTMAKTYGHYPAPLKILEVLEEGYEHGFDAGLKAEREGLASLMDGEAARNLMRLFFLRTGAKKVIGQQILAKPADIKRVAVVGGGTMGAGIVHALIRAGLEVRLVEVNPDAAAAALGRISGLLDEDVVAGRISALQARDAFHRVAPTTDWSGLGLIDFAIEAVVETMEAKRAVFAKLDGLCRADAVLATNTSSLSVAEMARATQHPRRVVGLHFFNPVPKMPLVEVVKTAESDAKSLATAAALAAKIGKTPILVADVPGFLVNRILIPYLAEALKLAADPEAAATLPVIDSALRRWGMPMGPFELLDEIGLDVAAHVLRQLSNSLDGQAALPPPVQEVLDHAMKQHWLGRKTGRGFYVYPKDDHEKGQPQLNAEMAEMLQKNVPALQPDAKPGEKANEKPSDKTTDKPSDKPDTAAGEASASSAPATAAPLDEAAKRARAAEREEAIQWRLVLPMVNEAARALAEGVTDSTDSIDLATVLGTGLAPFRGGLMRFADTVTPEQIVSRLHQLAAKHGARFEPAALLREMATAHQPLSSFIPRPAPDSSGTPVTAPAPLAVS